MLDSETASNEKATVFQKAVILLSCSLYAFSLFQPAFYIDRVDYDGWADSKLLALFGWSSILGGNAIGTFIWLANPLFFSAIIYLLKRKSAGLYLSLMASLLALSFSLLDSIVSSEAGQISKITSLENGYYLWVSSMITLAVGTMLERQLND